MKKLAVYIFIAAVVFAHVLFFMYLKKSDQPPAQPEPTPEMTTPPQENPPSVDEQPQAQNPPTVVETPKQNPKAGNKDNKTPEKGNVNNNNTDKSAKTGDAPNRQATTPPKATQPPATQTYSAGFFKVAEKPLTPALQKTVANVRSGLVIDLDTNTIIWQKDAKGVHPIASLTKLMTANLLMEHLASHPNLSLDTMVTVTTDDRKYFKKNAINGVYLDTNEAYSLGEYLMCMMVASANDCAYVVGRFLGDNDPDAFVNKMNERAKKMGLTDMHFNNANGLPVKTASGRLENTGSALSVAFLAIQAMRYPAIMKCAGTGKYVLRADKKNPFDVVSTNHIMHREKVKGVTGLKTGYTDGAGYCIVLTCEREGKKRMVVVMGVTKAGADRGAMRDSITKQLLEWSYK